MKTRLSLSVLALLVQIASAQESPFLPASVSVAGKEYGYRLLPPAHVIAGEKYPLVFFLHGAGERGSDNEAQLKHFPERMIGAEYRERFPCFVLAPQCPKDAEWARGDRGLAQGGLASAEPTPALQAALAAFDEVLRAYPIDIERIYLTGLSMGGAGTWDLASRHPDWFAAAVPICGGGDATQARRLLGMPLSVWHGAGDTLVQPERSREMVQALRAAGSDVQYHELEGVGHGAWVAAYDLDNALDWMFAQRLHASARLAAAHDDLVQAIAAEDCIAFLGASIVEAGNATGGFIDKLRTALSAKRPHVRIVPAGIGGNRVPDLLERYRADVIDKKATLVFVYIGINDVWHSESGRGTSPEDFEAGLRKLIRDFRANGVEVVLATPSVIGEKRPGENKLDAMLVHFAEISRKVAQEEGATLCDLQRAFHSHLRVFNRENAAKGVLTTDGVHLTAAGNDLLALEVARSLRAAVAKRGSLDSGGDARTLKVFLLAGQSNMEGKGAVNTLDHLADDPETAAYLEGLKASDGAWRVRDDVWVWFLDRKGALTTGFGSPAGAHGPLIGPELGFGWVLGEHFDEPVLLIKTAWGGKDVAVDFLPPSLGGPGPYYAKMIEHTRQVMTSYLELFPECGATEVDLAGFVWFQGWNDMVDAEKTAKYPERLAQMIRDVRSEFGKPNLPVVIGELGAGGPDAGDNVLHFRAAQAKVAALPEFASNTRLALTSPLYDMEAHELFESGVWEGPDKERFYRIASDRPYHYLGSGKIYYMMGREFGETMVELLENE